MRRRLAFQRLTDRMLLAGDIENAIPISGGEEVLDFEGYTVALTDDSLVVASDASAEVFGSFYLDNALVHAIRPAISRYSVPVIMVPGHNLGSDIYLSTPDGRPGWAQLFADHGFDVYVINDPEFDFSRGFHVEPFWQVPTAGAPAADPAASQPWADQDIWRRWGFGNPEGTPYTDTRFPTDHFDVFEDLYPFVSTTRRSYSDSIVSLLETTGPAIVMAHSAGGPQGVDAALQRPDLVNDLILVEPTGPPTANDFPTLAGKSLLGVYGDYIDSRNQGNRKLATEAAADLFAASGGTGEVISLPDDHQVFGNTHLLMQDDNNDFIADLMLQWLDEHADVRPREVPLDRSATPSVTTIPIASGLDHMAALPGGDLLVVGVDDSTGASAWTVDPLTASVTAADLTAGRRVPPWSQLAVDDAGYGVVWELAAGGVVSVRAIDASGPAEISVATSNTSVSYQAQVATSTTGNRSVIAWPNSGGSLDVLFWNNETAEPIGETTSTSIGNELIGFDHASSRLVVRSLDGKLHVLDTADNLSPVYSVAAAGGSAAISAAESQLAVVETSGAVRWFDLATGSPIGRTSFEASQVGSVVDVTFEAGTSSVRVLTNLQVLPPLTPDPFAVRSIQINDGEASRSVVSSVTVRFDGVTKIREGAFEVVRHEDSSTVPVTATIVPSASQVIATLTFPAGDTLADGNYLLRIRSDRVTGLSEDHQWGAEASDRFFRFFGDTDGDRDADGSDYTRFATSFLTTVDHPRYLHHVDHDGDGDIDGLDYAAFSENFLRTLPFN